MKESLIVSAPSPALLDFWDSDTVWGNHSMNYYFRANEPYREVLNMIANRAMTGDVEAVERIRSMIVVEYLRGIFKKWV